MRWTLAILGAASNLTPADFSQGLHEVLESLEEQVVLMRLLGESVDQSSVTVRIGAENPVVGLHYKFSAIALRAELGYDGLQVGISLPL